MNQSCWLRRSAALIALLLVSRPATAVDYELDIKPILKQRCSSCHGSVKQEADLRLDAGALLPESMHADLLRRVKSDDEAEQMPPEGARLSATQIDLLRQWIDAGAPHPADEVIPRKPSEHWAFQPVAPQFLPASHHAHPIDALLFKDNPPPERASQAALLRRVFLDLIGLPPAPVEQAAFANEQDLTRVIDQLLARSEYGERWARHWLDVVRYADSNGYERDAEKPFVWRYRDYVIQSLNNDKPFDRFAIEQIAGDELEDASLETHIATGFLRLGHWDDEPADPATDRFDQLDDLVSTTSQAFLALTMGCARCHDHKFEPLSQRDYYSLVAVFNPLERPRDGRTERTVNIEGTEVYAWHEPASQPIDTHILMRGSATRPGELVEPTIPTILNLSTSQSIQFASTASSQRTSQRRLNLARWIADDDNPLTARVIVNRIWQQHFGEGLVPTANDFGLMGTPPSNPELLDWLAHWFVHEADWSLKKLHRLIITSRAWQSRASSAGPYHYRRLEVEAIRDSMLAVSGSLNREQFGPAMRPAIPLAAIEANTDKGSVWSPSEETQTQRRSIYVFVKRGLIVPMFETLDLADTVSSCPKRQITTVAPQALTLFNGEFTQQQVGRLADRLRTEAGKDIDAQVRLAWQLALCRQPTDSERAQAIAFLSNAPDEEQAADEHASEIQTLEELCRVIFNLNEFVYPE